MRPKGIDWDAQPLGTESDSRIARMLGVRRKTVRKARIARGINAVSLHLPPSQTRGYAGENQPAHDLQSMREAKVQMRALLALVQWIERKGYPPSNIELGNLLGRSDAMAREWLRGLARKGLVEVDYATARGIRVTKAGRETAAVLRSKQGAQPDPIAPPDHVTDDRPVHDEAAE